MLEKVYTMSQVQMLFIGREGNELEDYLAKLNRKNQWDTMGSTFPLFLPFHN